jgi:hypothetical protein
MVAPTDRAVKQLRFKHILKSLEGLEPQEAVDSIYNVLKYLERETDLKPSNKLKFPTKRLRFPSELAKHRYIIEYR